MKDNNEMLRMRIFNRIGIIPLGRQKDPTAEQWVKNYYRTTRVSQDVDAVRKAIGRYNHKLKSNVRKITFHR